MTTNRNASAWDHVQTMAQLADLKDALYRNTLALSAMLELLVDRGLVDPDEFHRKTAALEREDASFAGPAALDVLASDPPPRYDAPTSSQAVDLS